MRKLYYAFTQLHLLYLVNMKLTVHAKCPVDLIILNTKHTGCDRLIKKIKGKNIFDRILVLENHRKHENGIKKISGVINEMQTAKKNKAVINNFLSNQINEYDEFFTFGSNMEAYIAYDIISKGRKVSFNYYEEGIGTYVHPITNMLRPWYRWFLNTNRINMPFYPDEIWVYMPDWLPEEISEHAEVKQMPDIDSIDTINDIWDYNSIAINERAVLFEQPLDKQDNMISELFHCFDLNEAIVKLHPRTESTELFNDMKIMESNNTIWELICLNNQLDDKLLVTYCSTACFTPKYLSNSEPSIIFLFNMDELKGKISSRMEELVGKLQKSYSNSGTIYLPKNREEYLLDIQIFLKMNNTR